MRLVPDGELTQQEQLDQLTNTSDKAYAATVIEEENILFDVFGLPDAHGVYGRTVGKEE